MTFTRHLPRICTGLALMALLGSALWLGGWYLFTVLLLFALTGMWEFYALFWSGLEAWPGRLFGLCLGALVLAAAQLKPGTEFIALGCAVLLLSIAFLCAWTRNDAIRFSSMAVIMAGLLYVPVLLLPVLELRFIEQLFLICATISSDTAAYFCGVACGKHKIWPAVSPNKSVEGSLAGLGACVLVCTFIGALAGQASLAEFALLAVGLGIMAQLGDFFESALKRSRRIKDSGSLLPGHGGVLDRADSLLFAIPTYAAAKTFVVFF